MNSAPSPGPASPNDAPGAAPGRIIGTGEMADLVRAYDWSTTPLGPIESWSKELVTIVNLTLCSPSPTRTMWGPEFILIYNDAYRVIPGPRHPGALGKPAKEVYGESWHVVGPLLDKAIATGETFFYEKLLVPLPTKDGIRDSYLNYAFNPIFENGKIAGLFGPLHDVTGEVTAARQLQESEARARRILDSIGDAVIVTDADSCITRMNPVAEALTGWTFEDAHHLPLPEVFRIVNEESRLPVESPTQKVKSKGTVTGLANHTLLIARDGREIHIDDSVAPIRSHQGEITGIVLVFRDINERRAAERERDAVTGQLNQVLESTTDSIISVGRDWHVTYLNQRAKDAVAPIRDLLGRYFWDCFPAALYEGSPYVENYNRAMNDHIPGTFEAHYGGPLNIWVQVNVRPAPDGIVIFFRDVTEEKQAKILLENATAALKESEEELRWTIELSPQVPWTADVEGRILDFSESWLKLTGLTREEAGGEGWMTVPHPDDVPRMTEAWSRALSTGEPYNVEHRIRTASGEYRWMRSSAFPRRNSAGTIVKWYGATEDIDVRKRAEEALVQSEKLAAVGRLASSIAHEINNPLESITNLVYLAQNTDDPNEIRALLDIAERELRRACAITAHTLRFYKQSSGPKSVDCDELLDTVLAMYQGRFLRSPVVIERCKRSAVPVTCFDGEIRQVLANLIGNALDAMGAEGGRLLLRSRSATHWKSGAKGVVLTVADTGEGMSKETQRRIFDPFFTTKEFGGTGLGLWVSKGLVERHQGSLRVRSRQRLPGKGTVITLFIPLEGVKADADESGAPHPPRT